MADFILDSVKQSIGLGPNYDVFDAEIITHINGALSTLTQLGVGPVTGFAITDETADWADFLQDAILLSMVKPYVVLKVKLAFDPPDRSFVIDAMKKQVEEYEWRMNVTSENKLGSTI